MELGASQPAKARRLGSMDIYSHCSGGLESQVKVLAETVPSESLLPDLHMATF